MKKFIYMLTLFAIANNTFCSDKKNASAGKLSIDQKKYPKETSQSDNSLMISNEQKNTHIFSCSSFYKKEERSQIEVNRRINKEKKVLIEQRAEHFKENHPKNCKDFFFIKHATGIDLEMIKHCCYCSQIWQLITHYK